MITFAKVCSIWMPLDPVPIETSIAFAVGSHLDRNWYKPRKFATHLNYQSDNLVSKETKVFCDVPSDQYIEQNYRVVRFNVQPGDCIVFHMRTLHSAPGNDSDSLSRRVLSTRWLGKKCLYELTLGLFMLSVISRRWCSHCSKALENIAANNWWSKSWSKCNRI